VPNLGYFNPSYLQVNWVLKSQPPHLQFIAPLGAWVENQDLGSGPWIVYTDHLSIRRGEQSERLGQNNA